MIAGVCTRHCKFALWQHCPTLLFRLPTDAWRLSSSTVLSAEEATSSNCTFEQSSERGIKNSIRQQYELAKNCTFLISFLGT